jgi:hypothetical protein
MKILHSADVENFRLKVSVGDGLIPFVELLSRYCGSEEV